MTGIAVGINPFEFISPDVSLGVLYVTIWDFDSVCLTPLAATASKGSVGVGKLNSLESVLMARKSLHEAA